MHRWILALALAVPSLSHADEATPFSGSSGNASEKDLIPAADRPENRGDRWYGEQYTFSFYLDGDYSAWVTFVISNLQGEGRAAVTGGIGVPGVGSADKKEEFSPGEWSYSKDRFHVTMGDNSLEGDTKTFKIHLKNAKYEAEFTLVNKVPSWKPGGGRVTYKTGENDYYEFQLVCPWAGVTGRVKRADESEWHEVKGLAYGDHSRMNIEPYFQSKRSVRFRSLKPDHAVIFSEIHLPERFGNGHIPWAFVAKDGKVVFESLSMTLEPKETKSDTKLDNPYTIPVALVVEAMDGGRTLKGAVKATKMTSREDHLSDLGKIAKMIVSKFAHPVTYNFNATYKFQIPGVGSFSGQGRLHYTQVN